MATRMNPLAGRYFNSSQFGQALSNLASAFSGPGVEDMLAGAQYRAADTQARAIADMYAAAGGNFDQLGVVADLYDPSNSYYAVNTADATNRYGIDTRAATDLAMNDADNALARELGLLSNETDRYGIDVGARTDLSMNEADNAAALEQALIAAITDRGTTPLTYGQAVPAMDLTAFGGPALDATGGAALGAPADPMSTDEVTAALLADAVANNPGLGLQVALNDMNTMNVVGPDGQPSTMFTGLAGLYGAEPYVNQGSTAATETANWSNPGTGQSGTAFFDTESNIWRDTQTKEAIPAGSITGDVQDTVNAFGGTTSNQTEYARVVAEADYGLGRIDQFRTLLQNNPGIMGAPGAVQSVINDVQQSFREIEMSFGPDVPISGDMVNDLVGQYASSQSFDPAFAQAVAFALEMAYFDAKAADPSGEVNVRELERQLSVYLGGLTSNNARVMASLDVLESRLRDRKNVYAPRLLGGAAGDPSVIVAPEAASATGAPATAAPPGGASLSTDDLRWLQGGP